MKKLKTVTAATIDSSKLKEFPVDEETACEMLGFIDMDGYLVCRDYDNIVIYDDGVGFTIFEKVPKGQEDLLLHRVLDDGAADDDIAEEFDIKIEYCNHLSDIWNL